MCIYNQKSYDAIYVLLSITVHKTNIKYNIPY